MKAPLCKKNIVYAKVVYFPYTTKESLLNQIHNRMIWHKIIVHRKILKKAITDYKILTSQ